MIRYISTWVIIIAFIAALGCSALAQEKTSPVVLIFQTEKTQDFDNSFATAATRSIKTYFRETQRVEVMIFDRESPTVERAVLDKKLSADSVASYSTREQKIEVAKVLGFDYAAGTSIALDSPKGFDKKILKMSIWLVDVNHASKGVWEANSSVIYVDSDAIALNNTLQSVANRVVLDVTRQAFAKLPVTNTAEPTTGIESAAIGGNNLPEIKQPDARDYSSKAQENISAGDLAGAIEEYSSAVNSDPFNGPLRIKLAEAYAKKKMYKEALDTLDRAIGIGADKGMVDTARQKIEAMQNGQSAPVVQQPEAAKTQPKESESTTSTQQTANTEPVSQKKAAAAAVAKIVEGDKLWDKGDPDEAAKSYAQAITLNPSDWRAHERLVLVNASMSLYGESRNALKQLKAVQPNPSSEVVANRYKMLRKIFDRSFVMLLNQYDSESNNFNTSKITRESYYSTIKGLSLRSEAMAKFLDTLTVPAQSQPASLHRSLACGLFAQAASSTIDYLETNSTQSKSNAQTFVDQARKELDEATRMDQDKSTAKNVQPEPEQPDQGTDTESNTFDSNN